MCKLECLLHLFDNTLLQEVVVQRFAMLMVEILKMIFFITNYRSDTAGGDSDNQRSACLNSSF